MSLFCTVSQRPAPAPLNLLALLQALQDLSRRMCQAAENGQWDTVAEMQETSAALIARLRPHIDDSTALPADVQACKQETLLALLRDDARLRALAAAHTEPPANDPLAAGRPHWLH